MSQKHQGSVSLASHADWQPAADRPDPVLLCAPAIRSGLRRIVSRSAPRLGVISHGEIPADVRILGEGVVRMAGAH